MTLPKQRLYITRPRWWRRSEIHALRYTRESRTWATVCALADWLAFDLPGDGRMVGLYDEHPPITCPACVRVLDGARR